MAAQRRGMGKTAPRNGESGADRASTWREVAPAEGACEHRAVTSHSEPGPSSATTPGRIAHLTTVDMSLALLLATELEERVHEGWEVFGISAPGPYVERVEAFGVHHVAIPQLTRSWSLGSDAKAFVALFRTLRGLQLDVLHTHNPKTGVMGRIAGRLAGVPVVVNTCHGLWARPDDRWQKRWFVYGLEGFATRFSDFELFQNAQDEQTLRRYLRRGRHRVVGNGVDLGRFRPDPEGARRLREDWGIPTGRLVVGSVGRRVAEKGLLEFVEAARRLRTSATFVWVGPRDDATHFDEGLAADHVLFVPEQTEMPAVYSAFDIFVLASHREGFSRASMEAAACGLPMVLSDIRGCREIGTDGVDLVLVPPHDPVALTARVGELLENAELRTRLSRAARARSSAFDQRRVARDSAQAYEVSRSLRRDGFTLRRRQ